VRFWPRRAALFNLAFILLNLKKAAKMKTPITNRFTRAYGIDHPIAAAGMAFAGMAPGFTIASANAGILGSFAGVGLMPPDILRRMLTEVFAGTSKPFHVNFITIFTTDAHIQLCIDMKVRVVSFHWGSPKAEWVNSLHAAGIKVWEQVGSVEAAKEAVAHGVDCVVAQGSEAGGHNYGALPTFVLVPAVRDAIGDVMLLASGGIADGRGLAAALALGADGAWVGTRLVATVEAHVHENYKARLVAARGVDTVKTRIFGKHHPDFNPIRVLKNRVVEQWHARLDEVPSDNAAEAIVGSMDMFGVKTELRKFTNLVPMPSAEGDFDELPLLAGQGVGLIDAVKPMREVVEQMVSDAAAVLAKLSA
jgi:NAD(P)H-dependent flavin oxidoreductase YrpB (nitropropane dioxygenase family)